MVGFNGISGRRTQFSLNGRAFCALFVSIACCTLCRGVNPVAHDIDRAREICDSAALSGPEGIWLYPDDNVTVLVLRNDNLSPTQLPEYEISVVETTDCSVSPGERIGSLKATADPKKFAMSLFTERDKGILSRKESCTVTLGNENETLMLPKKKKSRFRLRYSINPYSLLPKMWRIVRLGISQGDNTDSAPPVGLVKIYPSYDGNGSSRRAPRYL